MSRVPSKISQSKSTVSSDDVDYSKVYTRSRWGSRTSLSLEQKTSVESGSKPTITHSDHEIPEDTTVEASSDKGSFNPTPYTFTLPTVEGGRKDHRVECPPFHTLLDHTIAVIWILYCNTSSTELGIVHLYWALSFLQTIRNHEGETPDDIAMIIEAIQIRLAHMHIAVETFIDPQSSKLKSNVSYKHIEHQAPSLTKVQSYTSFQKNLERMKSQFDKNAASRNMINTDNNYPVSATLKDMLESDPETLMRIFSRGEKSHVEAQPGPSSSAEQSANTSEGNRKMEMPKNDLARRELLAEMKSWTAECTHRMQVEVDRLRMVEKMMKDLHLDFSENDIGREPSP